MSKKNIPHIGLALILCIFSIPETHAQVTDTAFAEVSLDFLREDTSEPLEGVDVNLVPLETGEFSLDTIYDGITDIGTVFSLSMLVCVNTNLGILNQFRDEIKVYPNPNRTFQVRVPDALSGELSLSLFDSKGSEISQSKVSEGYFEKELSMFSDGLFVWVLTYEDGSILSGKFLKGQNNAKGSNKWQSGKA